MNRDQAYQHLRHRLAAASRIESAALVGYVGRILSSDVVAIEGEMVEIELRVAWADTKQQRIRIDGLACGPSWHKIDRIEEHVVVEPDPNSSD